MRPSGTTRHRLRPTAGPIVTGLVAALLLGLAPAHDAAAATAGGSPGAASGPIELARESGGVSAVDVALDRDLVRVAPGVERTGRLTSQRFSMVGLTWRGDSLDDDAALRVRVHADGGWQPWRELAVLGDGPDAASAESARARRGTDLAWVGAADGVRVEVGGPRPADLRLTLIEPSATAPAAPRAATSARPASSKRPVLRSRRAWGADPSLRSGRPTYNRTIQQVHIHHTANSNGYRRGDVAGLIRGIYRYHTQSLGWSDVGYNFLVDRFGRTWVGRAGGAKKAVRGAHTLGFNSTSTGVAVIGNFETGRPGRKVVTALVRLAAWKLDRYDRRPRSTVRVYSHGSDRYAAGRAVRLPTIDGHRDTNETACPGARLYDLIPKIRRRAAQRVASF